MQLEAIKPIPHLNHPGRRYDRLIFDAREAAKEIVKTPKEKLSDSAAYISQRRTNFCKKHRIALRPQFRLKEELSYALNYCYPIGPKLPMAVFLRKRLFQKTQDCGSVS